MLATCLWPAKYSGFLDFPFLLTSSLFLSFSFMFLSFSFFYVSNAHWSISAVVSMGILCVFVPTIATCVCDLQGIWSSPFSYPLLFSKSCPSISLYDVPFLSFSSVFWNHWSISAVVSIGILCVFFPIIATCVCVTCRGSGVPPSLILFSFLVLSFYDVPSLSCSSMFLRPIDLYLL